MNTATIFKEEINNPAIWDTIIRDLGLPTDTDEIIIKAVSHLTETQRQETRKKNDEQPVPKKDNPDPVVQIVIAGGAVQSVIKPTGIALEIRDYDVKGSDAEDDPRCRQDEEGDYYQRMFWDEDETE